MIEVEISLNLYSYIKEKIECKIFAQTKEVVSFKVWKVSSS